MRHLPKLGPAIVNAQLTNAAGTFPPPKTLEFPSKHQPCKKLGITKQHKWHVHGNERSATGFLPPDKFDVVANEFFAHLSVCVRDWERAVDAQARIVHEVEAVLDRNLHGDILFVGHGAVGTLLTANS